MYQVRLSRKINKIIELWIVSCLKCILQRFHLWFIDLFRTVLNVQEHLELLEQNIAGECRHRSDCSTWGSQIWIHSLLLCHFREMCILVPTYVRVYFKHWALYLWLIMWFEKKSNSEGPDQDQHSVDHSSNCLQYLKTDDKSHLLIKERASELIWNLSIFSKYVFT